jgi:hypothetical protein
MTYRASIIFERTGAMDDRFEQENGAYHFALQDIVNFIYLYGYDTVMTDIVDEYHSQIYHKSKAERSHTEFGGFYGL